MTSDLAVFLSKVAEIFNSIYSVFMLSRVVIQYFVFQNVPKLCFISRQGSNEFCLFVLAIGHNIFTLLSVHEPGALFLELKFIQELLNFSALESGHFMALGAGHVSSRCVIGIGCVPIVGYRQTRHGVNCHDGSIVQGWNKASYLGQSRWWNNVCP